MASKVSIEQLLIGGLPADKFTNRTIRVDFPNNSNCACKCLGFDAKRGTIIVVANDKGRLNTVHVEPKQCHPWWSKNPDLKIIADTRGVNYSGEVSVGRALAEALKPHPTTVEDIIQVADRTPRYRPPAPTPTPPPDFRNKQEISPRSMPPTRALPSVGAKAAAVSAPAPVVAPEPAPEPVMEPELALETVSAPEPAPEPAVAPEPVMTFGPAEVVPLPTPKVSRPIRKLLGIKVPLDAPDDWMEDYREFKRIAASCEPASAEIERLRAEIARLEAEQEDDKLLLELHIEQLEAKGITLEWETVQAPARGPGASKPGANKFTDLLLRWVRTAPDVLTFKMIFEGIGMKDNATRRIFVKAALADLGYRTIAAVAASGNPAEFHKPTAQP